MIENAFISGCTLERKNYMHKSKIGTLLLLITCILTACNGAGTSSDSYAVRYSKTEERAVPGGIVTYAYTSPFQGLFDPAFLKARMIRMYLISLLRACSR